jgi:ribonuclease D
MPEALDSLPELIQEREDFNALVEALGREPRIAVDTESNSLHAYRERVCLMQFSTPRCDFVVDVLALEDVEALGSVFENPGLEKIFHAAEYDIICLRRDYGFAVNNIFDTMQAGRILGRKMAGLDRLLEEKFGVKVNKRLQKADWGARPLKRELLEYASLDTHYLIALRDILEQELREKGLLELAQEDFRLAAAHYASENRERSESPSWDRLRARRDLSPQELTILKELLDWRERAAEGLDRPPFKVMGDDKLIEIARLRPANPTELNAAGLSEKQMGQWGVPLLEAVARGLSNPVVQRKRSSIPDPAYMKRLEMLKEWRKKAAALMDVESDVVLPRGLLLELADRGAQDVNAIMHVSPWRKHRFGEQISAVLQSIPS